MDMGKRIRRARRSIDMTQGELGKLLGVSRPNVSSWERGFHRPLMDKLVPLSDALGVSVDYILRGEEKVEKP